MVKISEISTIALADMDPTDYVLGTDATGSNATKNFSLQNLIWFMNYNQLNGVPANSGADGKIGTFMMDATYLYICYATNTWRRVAIAAF